MAKAIFHREFHYSSRKHNVGWSAYPKPEPQNFPREFIDAAVKAGCAKLGAVIISKEVDWASPEAR